MRRGADFPVGIQFWETHYPFYSHWVGLSNIQEFGMSLAKHSCLWRLFQKKHQSRYTISHSSRVIFKSALKNVCQLFWLHQQEGFSHLTTINKLDCVQLSHLHPEESLHRSSSMIYFSNTQEIGKLLIPLLYKVMQFKKKKNFL